MPGDLVTALRRFIVIAPLVLGLAACGGGGSGGSSTTTGPGPGGGAGGTGGGTVSYTVSTNAGSGGSISPTKATVDSGTTASFAIAPASGYSIVSVSGCGGNLSGTTYTTAPITADCTVTATFSASSSGGGTVTHTVTATAGSGGTISPTKATVNDGGAATFTVTPNSGYGIGSISGCGGTLSGDVYTTGTVTADCSVAVTFSLASSGTVTHSVTATAGSGGTITPSMVTVDDGATTSFSVTPETGFGIAGVTGCGGTLSGSAYTTAAVTADCAVAATFTSEWAWISGSDQAAAKGVYGTLGTGAAGDSPGGRAGAAAWYGASGKLWLFGGYGQESTGTQAYLNDLWTYDTAANQWTWVGGSNTANATGVYGTQGSAAAGNVPGARAAEMAWRDASGNLWLFGGYGYDVSGIQGYLNDLWKFDPATNQWTWMGGSNTANAVGNYGTEGTAAVANVPGARAGAATWLDASGNLWLFGGYGYDMAGDVGYLNDLWEYSTVAKQWTWVSGAYLVNVKGVYGTQGTAAAGNVPGARGNLVAWVDDAGNFWLFGGYGSDITGGQDYLNDLWKYDPVAQQWTWMSGSSTMKATGVYGTQGVAAAANVPGARGGMVAWKDASGHLWLAGGYGYNAASTSGDLNDLWRYDPGANQWTWMRGSSTINVSGVYGTQGVAAAANLPGGRKSAAAWLDTNGNLWVFGGYGEDSLGAAGNQNDLWVIRP